MNSVIDKMPFVDNAGLNPAKCCLSGTREAFIHEMQDWIYSQSESGNIMILTGAAGTGKSSIAHSLALMLAENQHLGCFFGFNSAPGAKNFWELCFSTIARKLAEKNSFYKKALHDNLEKYKDLAQNRDPATQFSKWILEPIQSALILGPLVIIIDALDESGDEAIQEKLLEVLLNQSSNL